jgi:hypothetical protein
MGLSAKGKKVTKEEREKILRLKHKYENRITVAKHGKESLDAGDYGNALKKFIDYFMILVEVKDVKNLYELRVNMFDPKKDLTELLMISHIYFEMARMYDAVPKFHEDSKKCLEQFVHFSANQPFQVVNSDMVRKYLKKSVFKNPDFFRHSYQQIYVQSKKCYIVTYCYGDQHSITNNYRELKDWLLSYTWGQTLVREYYKLSSVLISQYGDNFWVKCFSSYLVRPLLLLFSKTILPVIIKKC